MASAVEELTKNTTSENPASFYDFYNAYGRDHATSKWMDADPYGLGANFQNFVKGTRDSALMEYDNYLAKLNQKREDTSYQRSINDIIAAGYNPYMALGSISSSNSAQSYERKKKEKSDSSLVSTALKILALILLKKA